MEVTGINAATSGTNIVDTTEAKATETDSSIFGIVDTDKTEETKEKQSLREKMIANLEKQLEKLEKEMEKTKEKLSKPGLFTPIGTLLLKMAVIQATINQVKLQIAVLKGTDTGLGVIDIVKVPVDSKELATA